MMTRLARLAAGLSEPLLVTDAINVRYLTGFESSNSALLVEPEGTTTLYTDFRYLEAASTVEDVEVAQTQRDVAGALAELLAGRRVGFEASRISYLQWETIGSGGAELVPTRGLVEALRKVKDASEVESIGRAAAIVDAAYEALTHLTIVGRTEVEVAWWLERTMREHGAEALAFGSIVAAGVNGSRPHADPTDVPIEEGTLVTVDMGCVVDGYRSDCTRTFATGDLPAQLEEAYGLVAQAQLDGLAAVRAGAFGPDVDAASRVRIAEAGLADAYGHGLGHGVGLDVHEAPTLRPESTDTLAAGNVVTVEPGLYLPGVGGCRIEDLVVVTDDGCEILSSFTKEMLVVA
jgi:Xaa-Pro aminopeptidase